MSLYSHHLSGRYCTDIVRRNSVLVTHGSWRVKKNRQRNPIFQFSRGGGHCTRAGWFFFILEDIILLKNIRICLGMNVVPYSSRTNFKVPHSSIIYQTATNFLRMGRVHICKPAFFQFDTFRFMVW